MVQYGRSFPDPDAERRRFLDQIRGMELLPEALKSKLPKLYSGEKLGLEAIAKVKFFTPDANWSWYGSEYDGQDIFFGLVVGHEIDLAYFSLMELRGIQGPMGLPIERDLYFEPKTLGLLIDWCRQRITCRFL